MERRQLECFLAVHEHASMAETARRLHVSQPALSQSIKSLEREVGMDLFYRLPRGVRLTPAGEILLDSAKRILRDLDTAKALLNEVLGVKAGYLDIVSLPGVFASPLAHWIGLFRKVAPGVTIRVYQLETPDEVIAAVKSGDAELGFTFNPSRILPELVATEVGVQELVAVFPPGCGPAAAPDVSIEELMDFGLIAGKVGTLVRDMAAAKAAEQGREWQPVIELDRRDTAMSLVLSGAGVVVLPRPAEAFVAVGQVSIRDLRPKIRRSIHVVHRAGRLSPAAVTFLQAVEEENA